MKAMPEYYCEYTAPARSLALRQYCYQAGSYHYNWHEDIELLLVLQGRVEVCGESKVSTLDQGDLILINSNVGHATFSPRSDGILLLLRISPLCFKTFYPEAQGISIDCSSAGVDSNLPIFRLLRQHLADMMLNPLSTAGQRLRYERSLLTVMDTLVNCFAVRELRYNTLLKNQTQNEAVAQLTGIIDQRYHQRISLRELGRLSSYHPSYVSQLFKSCMGINYMDYLTRIRMREAVKDLHLSDDPITDIALRHGFADIKSFNQNFKAYFSKTPGEFRRQLTEEMRKVDLSFQKQYIRRDNEEITALLERYATGGRDEQDAPGCYRKEQRAAQALSEVQLHLKKLQVDIDRLVEDIQ